jgi:hypothetical protein
MCGRVGPEIRTQANSTSGTVTGTETTRLTATSLTFASSWINDNTAQRCAVFFMCGWFSAYFFCVFFLRVFCASDVRLPCRFVCAGLLCAGRSVYTARNAACVWPVCGQGVRDSIRARAERALCACQTGFYPSCVSVLSDAYFLCRQLCCRFF